PKQRPKCLQRTSFRKLKCSRTPLSTAKRSARSYCASRGVRTRIGAAQRAPGVHMDGPQPARADVSHQDVNMKSRRRRGTEFSFAIVPPDRYTPRYVMREIGLTVNGRQRGVDDNKTGTSESTSFLWSWMRHSRAVLPYRAGTPLYRTLYYTDLALAQSKFEVDDYMEVGITMPRGGPGGRFNGPPRGGRIG
ncbi:putative Sin3 associated polypeptide p18, partial [Aphelenchoides avenae]